MHHAFPCLPLPGIRRISALAGLLVAVAASTSPMQAQLFLPGAADETTWQLQLEKPFFEDGGSLKFFTSVLDLDVMTPLGDGPTLVLGVPLAVGGADDPVGNGVYLGNLRATVVFGEPGAESSFLGVTLPTATDGGDGSLVAFIAGLAGDLDRPEDWLDEVVGVRGGVTPSWDRGEGRRIGIRVAGAAVAPDNFDDLNVYLRPGVWGSLRSGDLDFRGDLSTSYFLNSDDGFGQQFTAYLDLGVDLLETSGRPGFYLRVPLDGDTRELLNLSLGGRVRF